MCVSANRGDLAVTAILFFGMPIRNRPTRLCAETEKVASRMGIG